jgi:hypothetical protein
MSDKLPTNMAQSFGENNRKTAVFTIEAKKAFPNPSLKGQEKKLKKKSNFVYKNV